MGLQQSYWLVPLINTQSLRKGAFLFGVNHAHSRILCIARTCYQSCNCQGIFNQSITVHHMRYLLLLSIFISTLSFAQPMSYPSCVGTQGYERTSCAELTCSNGNECVAVRPTYNNLGTIYQCRSQCTCKDGKQLINNVCQCPSGTSWHAYQAGGGTCMPDSCPDGQIPNTINTTSGGNVTTCIDDPETSTPPEDCPGGEVYDPITDSNVCPGSEGSSSSSSNSCVVPGDFNGDCVPDDQQNSSANNSTPTSSPSNGSSGSAASTGGGGDDGGGDNGGGGGGDDVGGGNNGGGSAGSASSAFNPNSWNPYSGYGNWIPIKSDSPCPNKYIDVSGQWWCAGNGTFNGSASSAASNNSNSSGSNSSGSNSSGSSSSCPSKPQCSKNTGVESEDQQCKQLLQEYYRACPSASIENGLFDIDKDETSEGKPLSFENSLSEFKTKLSELENIQHLENFFQFNGSASCPVWQVSVWVFDVVIDQQCSPDIPWGLISGILIAVAVLLAARISFT